MNDAGSNAASEGRAALILMAALIDSLEKVQPGTNKWLDHYLVEALSRAPLDVGQRDAILVARNLLAGLRGSGTSSN